jgi:hypothetical protein
MKRLPILGLFAWLVGCGAVETGPAQTESTAAASNEAPARGDAPSLGAMTLAEAGKEVRVALPEGRSVSLTMMGYDPATDRSSFSYVLHDAAGAQETRSLTFGPQDLGWELEVHKTGKEHRALISVPQSTRWSPIVAAGAGDVMLLSTNEEASVDVTDGKIVRLKLTGYDESSKRNRFHYELRTKADDTLVESREVAFGPEDIGWEVEVLKASPSKALLIVPASHRHQASIAASLGGGMLLSDGESATIAATQGRSVALSYLGYDATMNRSAFSYATTGADQRITMGTRDIGWEIEVLKSAQHRSLVTIPVSSRW